MMFFLATCGSGCIIDYSIRFFAPTDFCLEWGPPAMPRIGMAFDETSAVMPDFKASNSSDYEPI